ncbi:unnamed protein product [Cladocopium goreaui]|uniref:Uncharacterized protein n=1 Tax=Cladocopium goreaui TaxID=2562237 RepID=A0A9P1GTV4_9DINO|nr:unnamed protein product [Cladocopium goreaui]
MVRVAVLAVLMMQALADQACQEETCQEESSTLMQLNHREMTGDEVNELNEGLPWWVKKKIIDSRRESHPAPPPPRRLHAILAPPQSRSRHAT